jgi:hypothetical protein
MRWPGCSKPATRAHLKTRQRIVRCEIFFAQRTTPRDPVTAPPRRCFRTKNGLEIQYKAFRDPLWFRGPPCAPAS